jgi:hypothetical protein
MNHLETEVIHDVLAKPLDEFPPKQLAIMAQRHLQVAGYTIGRDCDRLAIKLDEWATTGAWKKLADSWQDFLANWVKADDETIRAVANLESVLKYGCARLVEQEVARAERDDIDQLRKGGGTGANRYTKGDSTAVDIINGCKDGERPTGTSRAYAIRSLLKHGRRDLVDRIEAGEISANAAAIQAGIRKKPTPLEISLKQLPKLTDDEWGELVAARAALQKT